MKTYVASSLVVLSLSAVQAQAATSTADALMNVVTGLAVVNNSNLIFDEAIAGSPAQTVDADSTETDSNASFSISGQAGRPITINLPADGTVIMTNGNSSSDDQIAVNSFTSNPLAVIDSNGNAELYVGATRDALSPTQNGGSYSATFNVEVIY